MDIQQKPIYARGIKFFIEQDDREVARAFLYILKNDLHEKPLGLMEDVFVDENYRGQGIGSRLIKELISAAKQNNCYKIVATSRHDRDKVHELYERLGFKNWGKEFRIDMR